MLQKIRSPDIMLQAVSIRWRRMLLDASLTNYAKATDRPGVPLLDWCRV